MLLLCTTATGPLDTKVEFSADTAESLHDRNSARQAKTAFANYSSVVDTALGMVWCDVDMDGRDELVFTTWSAAGGGQLWVHTAKIEAIQSVLGGTPNQHPNITAVKGSVLVSVPALSDQLPWMADRIRGQRMALMCLPGRPLNTSLGEVAAGRSILVWWESDPVAVVVEPIVSDTMGCELQPDGCMVPGGWQAGQLIPLLDAFEGIYTAPYSRTAWPNNASAVPPVAAALMPGAVEYSDIRSEWIVHELSLCAVWNHTHYATSQAGKSGPRIVMLVCGAGQERPCWIRALELSAKTGGLLPITVGQWEVTRTVGQQSSNQFRLRSGAHGQAAMAGIVCYSHTPAAAVLEGPNDAMVSACRFSSILLPPCATRVLGQLLRRVIRCPYSSIRLGRS